MLILFSSCKLPSLRICRLDSIYPNCQQCQAQPFWHVVGACGGEAAPTRTGQFVWIFDGKRRRKGMIKIESFTDS